MRIRGRIISKGRGRAEGRAVVSKIPVTFLGGVDPATGRITERGHPLFDTSIKDAILIIPRGKGSTVGTYVLYQMKKNGTAPAGIIAREADEMVATGAILAGIPMMDSLETNPLEIKAGTPVTMDTVEGSVEVRT
jgi:predicted aconitase with swiveling domain